MEVCPSFNYLSGQLKLKASGASNGYGYNLAVSAPLPQPAINVSKAPRPSELVVLTDAAQVNTFQAPASADHPMLEEFYYVNATEATVHFRHQQTAKVAFCDGHVSPEPVYPGTLDDRLPQQRIGRLRPEILAVE